MSTASASLTVRGISLDVEYKDIKNPHTGVYPPAGRGRVAAPKQLDEYQVRLAVIKRLPWISRQLDQLRSAPQQTEREMVTGESYYVWGARRRLKVIKRPGRAHIEVDGDRLLRYAPAVTGSEHRRTALDRWYRAQLRHEVPALIARCEPKLDLSVPKWSIRP